jgi:hypothetical protein
MRRDRLPFSIPFEEHVGEAQLNIDRKALVRAGCHGAASHHGPRAETADRHIVNNQARHAKLRREGALDEHRISIHPRAGELLLDVAKWSLCFSAWSEDPSLVAGSKSTSAISPNSTPTSLFFPFMNGAFTASCLNRSRNACAAAFGSAAGAKNVS